MSKHTKRGRHRARRLHDLATALHTAWACVRREDGAPARAFCRWCLAGEEEDHREGCAVPEMRRRYDAAADDGRGVWVWAEVFVG